MAPKYIHTEVEGRKLRLSNLEKIIYPKSGLSKAQIVQYYLSVAHLYLKYSANRPTTLIRFPNGIDKSSFYAKTAPDWTPDWIKQVDIQHSEEKINYLVPVDSASLVWLANLTALELHPTQMTADVLEKPDHFIFDLDPDPNQSFENVKEICAQLKGFLESYDYTPFLKTSGGKGLHVYVPLVKRYSHGEMVIAVKELAQKFVNLNPSITTLHINKNKRKGKILLDIYRNHKSQTTVAPYSLRAKPNAPISMPILWEELEGLEFSGAYHLGNYIEKIKQADPWEKWFEQESRLHNHKKLFALPTQENVAPQLKKYFDKRDFEKTMEPVPKIDNGSINKFVIQLHDASNLHYDLRLEKDGVLLSWAIPRGIPVEKNEKRMAIQTEDHPVKYLNFEGEIPKGEYGAGQMWIMDKGDFSWISQKKNSYKFSLKGEKVNADFALFKTKDAQWILERKSDFKKFPIKKPIHMLAGASEKLLKGQQYIYEIKWDGIRVFIVKNQKQVQIISRSGRDITKNFPDIVAAAQSKIEHLRVVIDAELVCLDDLGRPVFKNIISRMHKKGAMNIEQASRINPCVAYCFDLLNLDGMQIESTPFIKRHAWLNSGLKKSDAIRISELVSDGPSLYAAAQKLELEGVMIKTKMGVYNQGARSSDWIKVKFRKTITCKIIGYTKGQGDRVDLFGSLHLVEMVDEKMVYRGRVGSGFNKQSMEALLDKFEEIIIDKKPIQDKLDEESKTIWIKGDYLCEIQYASMTQNGTLREPVFLHLRED